MIVAVAGHRPLRLGGFGQLATARLRSFAVESIAEIHGRSSPITHGISGLALGWDQACASAFSLLGIPWTAAIPCAGQESLWPADAQQEYRRLLHLADRVKRVSPGTYSAQKMETRNRWMVEQLWPSFDNSILLALWDGLPGGTKNCVVYARQMDVKVENVWLKWMKFKEGEGV